MDLCKYYITILLFGIRPNISKAKWSLKYCNTPLRVLLKLYGITRGIKARQGQLYWPARTTLSFGGIW